MGRWGASCVPGTLVALLLGAPCRAEAEATVDTSVQLGGGYDSNALLELRPADTEARARGAFVGLEPALGAALRQGAWQGFASYDGSLRQGHGYGRLLWSSLELGLLRHFETSTFVLAATVSDFRASEFAALDFTGVGPRLAGSLALSARWRLQAEALSQWRFDARDTQRMDALALTLRHTLDGGWQLGARASWLSLHGPSSFAFDWQRARLGPFARHTGARLDAYLAPFAGVRTLGAEAALQGGAVAHLGVRLAQGFSLRAQLDVSAEAGAREAGRSDRTELWLALAWQGRPVGPALSGAAAPPARLAPQVGPGHVVFRLRPAAGARSVRVIGSFDDWSQGVPLSPEGEGVFRACVPAAGRVRYHFQVDGEPVRPPDSPAYVPDGFGGVDGEVDVPPAAAGDVSPCKAGSF